MLRAGRREIDVAAGLGMLRGEDVVVHCALEEVGIFRVVLVCEEVFRELQHIVGVACLHALNARDELAVLAVGGKPLGYGVAAHGDGALRGDIGPKEAGRLAVLCRAVLLVCAGKAHNFGHLRVGVNVVDGRGAAVGHTREQPLVGISLGCFEIFCVACHLIGVGEHLVYASMLMAQYVLYLLVGESGNDIDTPVTGT